MERTFNIRKLSVELEPEILDEIKLVGVYKGAVKLHPEVTAQFNIWVVAQN